MEKTLTLILAEVLGLDPDAISSSIAMHNTSEWDSLRHINLISAIEQEFNTTFSVADIEAMTSLSEIMRRLDTNVPSWRT